MFSKCVENTVGKGEIVRYEQFLFSHYVSKRISLQTQKPGLVSERVSLLYSSDSIVHDQKMLKSICIAFIIGLAHEGKRNTVGKEMPVNSFPNDKF